MTRLLAWLRIAPSRARVALPRHGLKGFVRESVLHGRRLVRLQEEHVWYELRLRELPPIPPLEEHLRLVIADDDQLDQVIGQNVAIARRRVAAGHDQMMLLDGDAVLSSACVFRGNAEVLAAPGKQLPLPNGTVCCEDAYTSPKDRRRGHGSIGLLAIIARLREEGIERMLIKVASENHAARGAAVRIGFEPLARVRLDRIGLHKRVEVEVLNDSPAAAQLAGSFGARASVLNGKSTPPVASTDERPQPPVSPDTTGA
jgi:GNAT superfamily N-acetyltransferase